MRDDLDELGGVQGHQVLAGELRVNVGGVGDAERVVGVDGEDFGLGADEAFEVLEVAGDDVALVVLPEQQRLDDA